MHTLVSFLPLTVEIIPPTTSDDLLLGLICLLMFFASIGLAYRGVVRRWKSTNGEVFRSSIAQSESAIAFRERGSPNRSFDGRRQSRVNTSLINTNRRGTIRSIWHPLRQFLISGVVLVALTILCHRLHLNLATASLLYAAVVVFVSRTGAFVLAILVSIIASLCLAYLAPPAYSFRVDVPFDDVAIVVFLIISLMVAGLVSRLRRILKETLSSVNRKLIDAEERVRNRIGNDLDVDIAQRLALISVKLAQVSSAVPSSAGNGPQSRIKQLQEQTARAAADVQTLSHELRSYRIDYVGVGNAMRAFCEEFGEQQKDEIDFRSHDLPNQVPMEVSVSLFRVLQEALHNAARHSGVRHFEVELFGTPETIYLTVHDSGVGFDVEAAVRSQGLGLTSMRERLKLVNGTF